jgi:hypothetical protein
MGVPDIYTVGGLKGTDHASPYNYDTHVPLAFYGIPFQPGSYRTHAEPVDLAVTLASLLGINPPSSAIGRVLTEAITPLHRAESSTQPPDMRSYPSRYPGEIRPAVLPGHEGPR